MHTVIEGTYENGQITLNSKPNVEVKAKVKVIFEEIDKELATPARRPFGIGKGTIKMSPDFDEPLNDLEDYM